MRNTLEVFTPNAHTSPSSQFHFSLGLHFGAGGNETAVPPCDSKLRPCLARSSHVDSLWWSCAMPHAFRPPVSLSPSVAPFSISFVTARGGQGGGGPSARVRVHTHRADRFVQSDALGATHISDRRKYHTQKKKAASKRASDKASCGVCVWSVRVECCGVLWSVCVECVCGVCRFGREQSCVWTLFSPIQDLGQSASRALFYRSSLLLLPIFSSPFHAESIRAVKPRFDCTSMSIVSCLRRRSTSLCFLALIACVCRHTKGSHRVRPLVATFSTIE